MPPTTIFYWVAYDRMLHNLEQLSSQGVTFRAEVEGADLRSACFFQHHDEVKGTTAHISIFAKDLAGLAKHLLWVVDNAMPSLSSIMCFFPEHFLIDNEENAPLTAVMKASAPYARRNHGLTCLLLEQSVESL